MRTRYHRREVRREISVLEKRRSSIHSTRSDCTGSSRAARRAGSQQARRDVARSVSADNPKVIVTPFGLELLSTVRWVMRRDAVESPDIERIQHPR
jgi:hypothetical protein